MCVKKYKGYTHQKTSKQYKEALLSVFGAPLLLPDPEANSGCNGRGSGSLRQIGHLLDALRGLCGPSTSNAKPIIVEPLLVTMSTKL